MLLITIDMMIPLTASPEEDLRVMVIPICALSL